MRVRARILLSVAASFAISVVILLIISSILREMEHEVARGRVYDEIKDKTYALNLLTARLQTRPDPSSIRQIKATQRSLEDIFGGMASLDAREQSLVRQIRTNSRELGYSLEKLISGELERGSEMEAERHNLLVSQLWMRTQFIADDTNRLKQISQSHIADAQQEAGLAILALIVALILVNGAISFSSGRRIVRIQEDLKKQQQQRQLALDAAHMGWWHYDPVTRIAHWDDGYKEIFGVTGHSRLNDEILAEIIHPDDLPGLWAKVDAALDPVDPQPFATEYRINRPDGAMRWVEAHGIASFEGEMGNRRAISFVGTVADITERKQAQETVKASLVEKEVLLKEVHHRVKNNMQVISSLVALQADESKNAIVRDVLQNVTHRVRSMAMVHEKLYQSSDLARVEFDDYAQSLLNYLWRSCGSEASGIRLTTDLEPVSIAVNEAVPCGLILNELVSNALKHAFTGHGEGEVVVSLRSDGQGEIVLLVRDNGKGLPAGFDWTQAYSHSLGLRLVQMLAGQLHAAVEVSSGEGTEFKLIFGRSEI
jgi:PAS domain S-box-containing protein